jgi:hypothetical protein
VLLEALNDQWLCESAAMALGRLRPEEPRVKDALLRARDRKIRFAKDAETREIQEQCAASAQGMAAWALTQLPR